MGVTWITPTGFHPAAVDAAWHDLDLSSVVPAEATGVIINICNNFGGGSGMSYTAVRKNGSTDGGSSAGTEEQLWSVSHSWTIVGVDANRVIETYFYTEDAGDTVNSYVITVYGYLDSNAVIFTNRVDHSPVSDPGSAGWYDVDITADITGGDTAVAAIVHDCYTAGADGINNGLRANGSTDDRHHSVRNWMTGVIGLGAGDVFEHWIENQYYTQLKTYLIGYFKAGVTALVNGTDYSIGTVGAWTDLAALPAGATGGFVEAYMPSWPDLGNNYSIRKNGTTAGSDLYWLNEHAWAMVECDTNRVLEGWVIDLSIDFFLTAYSTGGGSQTLTRTAPASAALKSTLARTVTASTVLLSTLTRLVPASGVLATTYTRTVSASAALQATLTRAVPASAVLATTYTRTAPASAALYSTLARTVSASAVLATTYTRTATASVALQSTLLLTVPASAHLATTKERTVTASAALQGTETRVVPASACLSLIRTYDRTVPASATLQGTETRTVPASSALSETLERTVSASAVLSSAFGLPCADIATGNWTKVPLWPLAREG